MPAYREPNIDTRASSYQTITTTQIKDRRWRNVTCYKMMLIQKAVKQNKKKHLWFNKRVREISEKHKKKYFIDINSEEISTWHVKVEAPTIALLIFKSVLLIGSKWLNARQLFFLLHKAIVWDYRGAIKSFDLHGKKYIAGSLLISKMWLTKK